MDNNRIRIYQEIMDDKSFIKTYTRLVANIGAKEALVLGNLDSIQKHYANKRKLRSDGYFFSTYEKIAQETGLTKKQVISAVKELEDRKIILTDPKCIAGVTTKYYRVNNRMVTRYLMNDFDLVIIGSLISLQKYYENRHYKDDEEKAKFIDENGFFKCSFEKLIANTGLDEEQVKAIVKDLEEKEFINSKITTKVKKDKKTGELVTITYYWYKVNLEKASDYLLNIPSKLIEAENILADDYEDEDGSTKGSFFMAKKQIAQKIDPISSIVFADLWASFKKALKEGTLDEEEWFYVIQDKIASRTGISRKTICRKYLPILKESGIIDMEARSFPLKTYIRLNFDVMDEIFEINTSSSNNNTVVIDDEYKALTKRLIAHAEEISDIKWNFNYYEVGCIYDVVNELKVTEEQLKQVIENRYVYYKGKDTLSKMFTFSNVVGQPSKVVGWLKAVESTKEDAAIEAQAKEVTNSICEAMKDYTNDDVVWNADSNKADIIRKVLSWEENFNEEDLIQFAKARYDWCKQNNKKMTAFYKLFSKDEKEHITNSKNSRKYGGRKNNNTGSSDGVTCKSYTAEEIKEFKRRAAEIEAAGGQGVF